MHEAFDFAHISAQQECIPNKCRSTGRYHPLGIGTGTTNQIKNLTLLILNNSIILSDTIFDERLTGLLILLTPLASVTVDFVKGW
jgi:hypothetical protein